MTTERDRDIGAAIVAAAEEASAAAADLTRAQVAGCRLARRDPDAVEVLAWVERARLHTAEVVRRLDPLARVLEHDSYRGGIAPLSRLLRMNAMVARLRKGE